MIAESMQGATKLLEALERLGDWAGGAAGGGPSGPPSREVVRAFEAALDAAPAQAGATEQGALASVPSESGGTGALPGPAQQVPPLTGAEPPAQPSFRVAEASSGEAAGPAPDQPVQGPAGPDQAQERAVTQEDPAQELFRRLESCARPESVITPQELFRIQYLVGMLKVQVQAGLTSSQQSTQGMESLLRQSG